MANSVIELLVLGNTLLLLVVALFLNVQVWANRVNLLAHRARIEEAITRLEAEVHDLKAGSIVTLPPNSEA